MEVFLLPPMMSVPGMSRMTRFMRSQGKARTMIHTSSSSSTFSSEPYGTYEPSLYHFSITVHGVTEVGYTFH